MPFGRMRGDGRDRPAPLSIGVIDVTNEPDRYADHWSRADLVICHDCSDRSLVVVIPREEIAQHDAWHDEPDLDNEEDRETARIMGGAR